MSAHAAESCPVCQQSKKQAWHLLCPACWEKVPSSSKTEVNDLQRIANNTPRHITKCREIVRYLIRLRLDTHRDPSAEGTEAAMCGHAIADCPYAFDFPEGQQWLQAFLAAGGRED